MHRLGSCARSASICVIFLLSISFSSVSAQDQTVGLFQYDTTAFDGYTLFHPMQSTTTFLIDMYGRLVHSWESERRVANTVYLLENGHLLRTSRIPEVGTGRAVQEIAWDGTVVWEYEYYSSDYRQHHDIEPLPNGNVLILAWEFMTREEAVAAGRNPALQADSSVWSEHIVEVEPVYPSGGNIVWTWRLWDHLVQEFNPTGDNYGVVAEHSELIDVNFTLDSTADWIHANGIDYNPDLDQIVMSCRAFSEFWVIDHSTTTAEAASHTGGHCGKGGDILYRWGNPSAYGAGTTGDQQSFHQHDAHWIEPGSVGAGNIMIFSNGSTTHPYSTIVELTPPQDSGGHYPIPAPGVPHGPVEPHWTYNGTPLEDFYSPKLSGARRLPNGNTLICEAVKGNFLEVTQGGETVWRYVNPIKDAGAIAQGEPVSGNNVFRCHRYAPDYPGLLGQILNPTAPLESYPVAISETRHSPTDPSSANAVTMTAAIQSISPISIAEVYVDNGGGYTAIPMYDDGSHGDGLPGDDIYGAKLIAQPEGTRVSYYMRAEDLVGAWSEDPANPPATVYSFVVISSYLCGDINGDGAGPNVADLTFLVAYLFSSGTPPPVFEAADLNGGTGSINIADLTYLVAYLFGGGPAPDCGGIDQGNNGL
jgi:hypothetical protein